MDFLELAAARYSVRDFSDRPVPEQDLSKILEAARLAPTAVNYQPQRLYVVRDPAQLGRLSEIRPLFGAPLAIIVCYDETISWKNRRDGGHDSGDVDAAIVTTHMMMEAWELGIGSCWIGAFSPAEVSREFNIPGTIHPVAILALGYAAEGCQPSERHASRKDMEDTVIRL